MADFVRRSGIFRLRGGAHRIGVDFAEDCQGSIETFIRIECLIEARYAGAAGGIRLDIGSGSVAIHTDANWILVLYTSAESLRIPDWIEVIRAEGFRFCPNLREVIAGLQREIEGSRDCQKLEGVELSESSNRDGEADNPGGQADDPGGEDNRGRGL
jgi:hypothetical protein